MSSSRFWDAVVSAGSSLPAWLLLGLECCSTLAATENGLGVTLEGQGRSAGMVGGSDHPCLCILLPVKPRLGLHDC